MKKLLLPSLYLLLLTICSSAVAQSVVASAGGSNANGTMVLEWTVGEMMVETIADNRRGMYTQGFHQPLMIIKTRPAFPVIELLPDNLFVVAPNPTVSEFTVRIDSKYESKVQLQLTDALGRMLQLVPPSKNRSFRFNLRNQPSGTYILLIRNEHGKVIKHFSVIKAN